jgi:CBS-domain-containing membrane protein
MRRDWLQTAIDTLCRADRRNILAGSVAGLGAALAIGGMEWLSIASRYPLVIIPFATSIVLAIGSPDAEPAQPRALIGGHVVATVAGF